MDDYPTGTNAVVAVISYTGFDMEGVLLVLFLFLFNFNNNIVIHVCVCFVIAIVLL